MGAARGTLFGRNIFFSLRTKLETKIIVHPITWVSPCKQTSSVLRTESDPMTSRTANMPRTETIYSPSHPRRILPLCRNPSSRPRHPHRRLWGRYPDTPPPNPFSRLGTGQILSAPRSHRYTSGRIGNRGQAQVYGQTEEESKR